MDDATRNPCLTCREREADGWRGCCRRCYWNHRQSVRLGVTSWAWLEVMGEVLPAYSPVPPQMRRDVA